jgi:unsaturated chondroitin disaccharide hydrolase
MGKIEKKLSFAVSQMGDRNPEAAKDGRHFDNMPLDWWTTGFWPGILWILYDMTGKEAFKEAAWPWDERLADVLIYGEDFHHDVGFQFLPTAVIKYKLTGDSAARKRGLAAASFLAGRFNPQGDYIVAWNHAANAGKSIIDSCMNLSLLFWAEGEFGDPRFSHIARRHLDMVLKYAVRGDGSVRHILEFDPQTGEFLHALGGQGYSPDSAWSRGQAWAIYGLANAWRYTGNREYLDAARRVAHFFISALPGDYVPYWDFRLPSYDGEPRDSSAAACAASGLIEIARALAVADGKIYLDAAERILSSLTDSYSLFGDPAGEAILRAGTGSRPGNGNVDVPMIYGDYFYVEAIAKLAGWKHYIF